MKKVLFLLLIASPAWAQTQPTPTAAPKPATRPAAHVADVCAPIGRTAKGELVYSMKCDNLPAPAPSAPASSPQAEAPGAPPEAESEVRRSGLFGWSYDRR